MHKSLMRGAPAAAPAVPTKPAPALTLASLLGRAKAMTEKMKAAAAPAAAKSLPARVAAPKTTAKAGTVRRILARTGG